MPTAPPAPTAVSGVLLTDAATREAFARCAGPFRMAPTAVARPAGREEVAALLGWAHDEGVAVIPRGAGTGMPAGAVGPGVILDLRALQALGPVAEDGTVRVGAGVVAARLEAHAAAAGRTLPALPSSARRCTVGGMLANNAAGARTFAYGSVRAAVVEAEVVLADGRVVRLRRGRDGPRELAELRRRLREGANDLLRGWPQVRKNSSGYALDRFLEGDDLDLFIGAEGTLGVVTEATFRLPPRPGGRTVAVIAVPHLDELVPLVDVAREAGAAACEFLGSRFLDVAGLRATGPLGPAFRDAAALLVVEVEEGVAARPGSVELLTRGVRGAGVAMHVASAPREAARLWEIRHAASPVIAGEAARGRVSLQFIEDGVVPPGVLPEYLRRLQGILDGHGMDAVLFGHAGDGNVHVNPLVDVGRTGWRHSVRAVLEEVADLIASLGGTLAGEHGDGRLRAPFLERVWGSAVSGGFREVKRSLDPDGLLNPGVIIPLPGQDPLEGLVPA